MGWKDLFRSKAATSEAKRNKEIKKQQERLEALPDSTLTDDDCLYRQTLHHGAVPGACAIAFDSVQGLMAVGTKDGHVKVSGKTGVEVLLVPTSHAPVECMAFSQGRGLLAVGTGAGMVYVWDISKQPPRRVRTDEGKPGVDLCGPSPTSLHVPLGSELLFIGTSANSVMFLKLSEAELADNTVTAEELEPDAAEGGEGGTTKDDDVIVCSSQPLAPTNILVGLDGSASRVLAFSLKTRKILRTYIGAPTKGLKAAVWSGDGRWVAAGFEQGKVVVWNAEKEKALFVLDLPQYTGPLLNVGWGPVTEKTDNSKSKEAAKPPVLVALTAAKGDEAACLVPFSGPQLKLMEPVKFDSVEETGTGGEVLAMAMATPAE